MAGGSFGLADRSSCNTSVGNGRAELSGGRPELSGGRRPEVAVVGSGGMLAPRGGRWGPGVGHPRSRPSAPSARRPRTRRGSIATVASLILCTPSVRHTQFERVTLLRGCEYRSARRPDGPRSIGRGGLDSATGGRGPCIGRVPGGRVDIREHDFGWLTPAKPESIDPTESLPASIAQKSTMSATGRTTKSSRTHRHSCMVPRRPRTTDRSSGRARGRARVAVDMGAARLPSPLARCAAGMS